MEKVFSVSEFNEFINIYLNATGEVTVEGELGQINLSQGKWVFATIKDSEASVDIFSVKDKIGNFNLLQEGMLVKVYGLPRLYQKNGKFSISAHQIVPSGEGSMKIAFEKLKAKLESEGLFDLQRKRKLPLFPQKIGLLTAKNSQAYSDFVKVLKERMGGIKIYFHPINVQGKDSIKSIVDGFNYFNESLLGLDLVALVRGGGSMEDLQSFNSEEVARAIFGSKAPVVCGVGHEKDITIADLVSDLRASTPSNSAELIAQSREAVLREISQKSTYIRLILLNLLDEKKAMIAKNTAILERIYLGKARTCENAVNKLQNEAVRFSLKVNNRRDELNRLKRLLDSLDYKNTLKRGFSVTFASNGKVLRSVLDASSKSKITTELSDGKITSEVLPA